MKVLYLISLPLLIAGFIIVFIGNGFDLGVPSVQASLGILIYVLASFIHSTYKGRLSRGLGIATYVAYAVGILLVLLGAYSTIVKWVHQ